MLSLSVEVLAEVAGEVFLLVQQPVVLPSREQRRHLHAAVGALEPRYFVAVHVLDVVGQVELVLEVLSALGTQRRYLLVNNFLVMIETRLARKC